MNKNQRNEQLPEENQEQRKLSRRKLIHILATGGAITSAKLMPDQWVQPMVDTIMLPAHAGASPPFTPENFPENAPEFIPIIAPDLSPEQARGFINQLSPEQLEELRGNLSQEEQKQLDSFLE